MMSLKSITLPIIPLPQGLVLLPGITIRVPLLGRSDISALLAALFANAKRPRPDTSSISIGCVPINSPLLRSDGRQLVADGEDEEERRERRSEIEPVTPSKIDHRQLYMYGAVAKISGVQGRKQDDLALIVEGVRRLRIDRFVQMRPYFVAECAPLDDGGGRYFHPFAASQG